MVQCQQQTGVCTRPPTSEGGGRKCKSCHPDHFWKAGRYKLVAPVSKTGSAHTEVGALPTPSAILAVCQHLTATPNERKPMRPDIRYQSQLLYRDSYQADRVIRIRPAKLNFEFRPMRFGLKPKITTYECKTH